MKKISIILISLIALSINLSAQNITFCLKGVVMEVDDQGNALHNNIVVGDTIEGTMTYGLSISEDNSHGNTVANVGDYYNYDAPAGFVVSINNYTFQTDTNNVEFLVEVVNNYYNQDNISIRSYNNLFPSSLSMNNDNHIHWQLDDYSQTAVSNVAIPTSYDLTAWPYVLNHSTGLTVTGSDGLGKSIFIRTKITEIGTCGEHSNSSEEAGHEFFSNKLTIYPNPMADLITIKVEKEIIGSGYSITDQSGCTIMTGTIESENTAININQLSKGEYLVQIGTSKRHNIKLLKN